jgi:CheY-like chemotaxis protein
MPKGRTKYRVLVIDDDKAVADMLSVVCTKCLRALAPFSEVPERFDAVILDEIMPDLRGTQLAGRLLQIRGDIPIILMTRHGSRISLETILESGVRATLIKPVLKEWLQKAIAGLLK